MSITTLTALPEPRAAFDRISLRRLVLIRWVAVIGQAVTLLVVHFGFDFRVPLLAALSGRRLLGAAQPRSSAVPPRRDPARRARGRVLSRL